MTSPGIGAAGILGVALEDVPEPVLTSATPSAAGGTLAIGTYRYCITALNALGETMSSNEIAAVTTTATSSVVLLWPAVTGATGYNIYRTALGGAAGTELKIATVGAVVTYTDTAPGAPAGALPVSNTAYTPGVYTAPTKFIPFLSEGLKYEQDTQWRRPVRNTPGLVGAIAGNSHVEGEVSLEALTDTMIYFLLASRCTVVKTGAGPYTYTCTPSAIAIPARTLSITIVRNGQVFGYTGCIAAQLKLNVNSGVLEFSPSIIGTNEATQTAPSGVVWPTSTPFGAGSYSVQIPTATQVWDIDTFEFTSNDNGTPQYRLKNNGTGASFVNFGESEAGLKVERDFLNRTDYDAFKALTAQSITMVATKAADSVTLTMPAAIKDTYEVGIGSQGDLVRASIEYQGAIDGTGKHYQIVVVTSENI